MGSNPKNVSSGQKQLALITQALLGGCQVILEATWKWLLSDSGRNMYVDIYIPKYKLAIEYQGRQHYFFPNQFHTTYQDFEDQQKRDELKRTLLKSKGFNYYAWHFTKPVTVNNVAEALNCIGIKVTNDDIEKAMKTFAKNTTRKRRKPPRNKSKRIKTK